MAYEKHIWDCGETITEVKMNNIENGIEEALECCNSGGKDLVVRVMYDTDTTTDSDPEILEGDYASVLTKALNHEYVDGVLIHTYNYGDSGVNTSIYTLGSLNANSAQGQMTLDFDRAQTLSNTSIQAESFNLVWDANGLAFNGTTYHIISVAGA